MANITKQQWDDIEDKLKGLFAHVEFSYQGHKVEVTKQRTSETTFELIIYLDGKWCLGWGYSDCDSYMPIVEHLWRKKTKAYYTEKDRKFWVKLYGKRKAEKELPKLFGRRSWYMPVFTSAKTLVNKYKKLEGLELIKVG